MIKPRVIVVDFDGTCVEHCFPEVGADIGAQAVLLDLVRAGHKLILSTMRSNNGDLPLITPAGIIPTSGNFLDDAVAWFQRNGIPLYGIQANPTQHSWTTSPKPYGDLYIDDAGLGIPLMRLHDKRPYVDWQAVREWLENNDYLPKQ